MRKQTRFMLVTIMGALIAAAPGPGTGGWSILVDPFNGVTSDMPVSGTGIASSVGVVRLYKNGITNSIEQDPITTDTVGSYLAEFKISDASL